MNNEQLIKELTAKDENKALVAARLMIDEKNIDAFKILESKSEFLFDFVKNNVSKRLQKVINENNYRNIFDFLKIYIPDFEDALIGSLANYANEDMTDELLELLENGNDSEKVYAAKYFTYIPDTISIDLLTEYALDDNDNEALAFNAAKALGVMKAESAYKKAIDLLKSDDDFTVLKAVKFLVAYEKKEAVSYLLEAMEHSSMPENIAGEIPYLESLFVLIQNNVAGALSCFENILSGLGEILPLNQIFSFEIYDILKWLISANMQNKDSQTAVVLLSAYAKFETVANNEEYTFDEDKNTKQEVQEIYNLLKTQQEYFWNAQKKLSVNELVSCNAARVTDALHVISEYKITDSKDSLIELLKSSDEIVVCEAVSSLKQLNLLNLVDKNDVIDRLQDENKKAIIENLFIGV